MKNVIKLLAVIPTIAAIVSAIASFIFALDYPIVILHTIASAHVVIVCVEHYQDTVHSLNDIINLVCNKY
jgi:hypothetical protein